MRRRGLTLVELLVVIAILGGIIALLLPAVQASREAGRRTQCSSNMRQLLFAVHDYENVHGTLPIGGPNGHGWLVCLLPFVEQEPLYQQIDFDVSPDGIDTSVHRTEIQLYRCPSDGAGQSHSAAASNYSGNLGLWYNTPNGYRGLFQPGNRGPMGGGPLKLADIIDGTANTAAVSEILVADGSLHRRRAIVKTATLTSQIDDFAAMCEGGAFATDSTGTVVADTYGRGRSWLVGGAGRTWYNHVLAPNRPSCTNKGVATMGGFTAASNHPQGVTVAFADGHLAFQSNAVDLMLWRHVAIRDDGAPINRD